MKVTNLNSVVDSHQNEPPDKPLSNPLSRKISKILETRIENDKAAVDALKELSTFFLENTLKARRNLRGQIEQRTVAINQEFVAALEEVRDAVDNIYTDVKVINVQLSEMKLKLQSAKAETKHLTEQTSRLHKQRSVLEMQQQVAGVFSNAFLLTAEESALLQAAQPVVGPAFFAALDRAQVIKDNTKHLLQSGSEATALAVLTHISAVREASISTLYQWLLMQARHPEPSPAAPAALSYLHDRQHLFRLVVEEWVVVRRAALNRDFLHSLTHLSATHSPIEMGAHSPTRYVGDMLAWLHQALAAERDAMGALFGRCTALDAGAEARAVVSSIAESLCRPLKTRVEQLIVAGDPTPARPSATPHAVPSRKPVLLYEMSGLLSFYRDTIEQVTGPGLLLSALEEMQQLCSKVFLAALHSQVEVSCERLTAPPPSLTPAPGITALLTLLSDVITAATLVTHHEQDTAGQVVQVVVSPLLAALSSSVSAVSPSEGSVYILNCCHQLSCTMALLHAPAPAAEAEIEEATRTALSSLVWCQEHSLVAALGLTPLLPHLAAAGTDAPDITPLAKVPECSSAAVHAFMTKLDTFLSRMDASLLPALRLLVSTAHRDHVRRETAATILRHYGDLYSAVHDPQQGYSQPQVLMSKTPDVVRALLL